MVEISVDDHVKLRLPQGKDVEKLYAVIQNNQTHLLEWQQWLEQIRSRAHLQYFIDSNRRDTQSFLDSEKKQQSTTHPGFQLILSGNDHGIMGMIGFQGVHLRNRIASIGYWIAENHQGQGWVTRAVESLIDYSFQHWHLNRLEIQCNVENPKSMGIPERLGFTQEARLAQIEYKESEDRFVDHYLYRMLREDWE
ncbi:MAG: GNAT family N-acetyltransferase [Bacteroidota bacterium]